jgi:hypothetical protein
MVAYIYAVHPLVYGSIAWLDACSRYPHPSSLTHPPHLDLLTFLPSRILRQPTLVLAAAAVVVAVAVYPPTCTTICLRTCWPFTSLCSASSTTRDTRRIPVSNGGNCNAVEVSLDNDPC